MGGGGGPEGLLKILASLQKQPPPDGETQAIQQAANLLSMALSRVQMRSASSAKLLADAISKVQSAREALAKEGSGAVASPPDLGMTGGMPPGQLGQGGM
jgi:hypothetical protein